MFQESLHNKLQPICCYKKVQAFLLLFLSCISLYANDSSYVRKMTDTLASSTFFGRGYINDGMVKAGRFISDEMKQLGLEVKEQRFSYAVNTFPGKMTLAVNGKGKLTCVEPYPEPRLNGTQLDIELIPKRVEEMDPDFFSCLRANDILFIDSSRTVKFGSDVCFEFLEILPHIAPGVWVHVHDIFFPHDYPAEWLINRRLALNEQYLLEAFLSFNTNFSTRLANYWICLDHGEEAARLWPDVLFANHRAGSFWMKRIA